MKGSDNFQRGIYWDLARSRPYMYMEVTTESMYFLNLDNLSINEMSIYISFIY